MEWLAGRLAAYKVPERALIVDAVPRNGLTKVDRPAVTSCSWTRRAVHATEARTTTVGGAVCIGSIVLRYST